MADGEDIAGLFDNLESEEPSPDKVHRPRHSFVFESFSHDYVKEQDKVMVNNNNNFEYTVDPQDESKLLKMTKEEQEADERRGMPLDYHRQLSCCTTRHWVDHFHAHYRIVNVSKQNLLWMKTAAVRAKVCAGLSATYVDDLEECARKADCGGAFDLCNPESAETGYFVRTDRVSLKDGMHGVGPYFSLKQILESAVTARGGHQGVSDQTQQLKFYLFPWLPHLDGFREFRVFVCHKRVTAMSQQSLYRVNPILEAVADLDPCPDAASSLHPTKKLANHYQSKILSNWCNLLVPYIEEVVVPRIRGEEGDRRDEAEAPLQCGLESFILDIVLLGPSACTDALTAKRIIDAHEKGDVSDSKQMPDLFAPELLTPHFIEINPFGYNQSSGSSLFSWTHEYSTLYGLQNGAGSGSRLIPVRFTRS
ncbi:unnamed protein product [Effrenium voratum]|uniref:Uncharacterized protein n=1 Tax=Effrenium voratum TaxID=2562239 RepID=A0AA36IYV0_9DINO|nr:unnamed protein product [Effrenium voratum]